jgi:multiple sugar transport system ATP-binding protein
MTLGQRVAVLKDGKIQQCDVPQRLFDEPANLFVGAFIGSPAMNLVEATVADRRLRFGEQEIELEDVAAGMEGDVVLGIRPTSLALPEPHTTAGWPRMSARIDIVEALGAERNVLFTVDAPPVTTEDVRAAIGGAGGADEDRLLADDRRARFTARIHGQHPIVPGDTIELAIDPSQLHLFERESGRALEWRSRSYAAQRGLASRDRG